MLRKIIQIDEDKCNGCGACATACHEGAIAMLHGKAKLIRDDYCDGLGDCLPACPTGAITFVVREAAAYDEAAVLENQKKKAEQKDTPLPSLENSGSENAPADNCGCAGTQSQEIKHAVHGCAGTQSQEIKHAAHGCAGAQSQEIKHAVHGCAGAQSQEIEHADENVQQTIPAAEPVSRLSQWPVQIKLAPVNAPYFNGAKLLIAADCTAFAYANFHERFIKDHITLVGCPKLDSADYSEKLTEIIRENDIESVTIVRMEVPCCGGLEYAAKTALQNSGKFIPWQVVTISIDGKMI